MRILILNWYKAFKKGRKYVGEDTHSGRLILSTNKENVEVVQAVMAKDHTFIFRMIAEETGSDKNAVHRILLGHFLRQKICTKLVWGEKSKLAGNLCGLTGIIPNFVG